ncbi:MAG: ATP-binding protein [bacterium]
MPKIVKRELLDKVARHLEQKEMTIILGPRQVGKTVLLGQLQSWLQKTKKISPELILYYNLDIIKDWEIVQDQTKFIEFLKTRSIKQKIYVFIDEAQTVQNPGKFYKGIYDSNLNIKLVLTGSSALEFASQIKESLAGRKRIFYLYPFSFAEFLSAKNKKLYQAHENELKDLFKEYIIWGGYPRVAISTTNDEKQSVLSDIYSSYIEKDIIGFLKIKNKTKFNKLIKLLAGQIGQLINIDELAANTELDRDTVYRYIKALEETYIISILTPYFRNPRQEIIKNPKVYFIDNGMRNYLLDDFKGTEIRQDRESLFENSIFKELFLLKQEQLFGLHFWRTRQGAEVDFVIERGQKLIPVEAKFDLKSAKSSSGLRSFVKKYKPANGFIINLGLQEITKIEKPDIHFIQPYNLKKFMLY